MSESDIVIVALAICAASSFVTLCLDVCVLSGAARRGAASESCLSGYIQSTSGKRTSQERETSGEQGVSRLPDVGENGGLRWLRRLRRSKWFTTQELATEQWNRMA